jgi:hypothetical protein
MSTTIKGTVRKQNSAILIEVGKKDRPKWSTQNLYKLLGSIDTLITNGDDVSGYLTLISKKDNNYGFYITKQSKVRAEVDNFINIIEIAVIDRINIEPEILGSIFKPITQENILKKGRKRELAFCRHLIIHYIVKYLKGQVSYSYIAHRYSLDRTSVYHAVDTAIPDAKKTDGEVEIIMDDLDKEIELIYNQITNI